MLQPATRTNRDPFLARPLEPAVAHHTMTTRSVYCCAQAHLIPISLDRREAMCSLRRMPRCRHYHSGSVLEDTLSLTHDNTGAFSPCQQWTRRFHLAKRQAVPSETAALACHPQVKHQARSMPIGLVNNCMALKSSCSFPCSRNLSRDQVVVEDNILRTNQCHGRFSDGI
jgi:hypothetical protein